MRTEQFGLSGFTRVDIRGVFHFGVVKSDTYGVIVERSWIVHPRALVQGDTLVVYEPWYDLGHTAWLTPRVKVGMPELRELKVSGASVGSVTGFSSSQDFRLKARGGSHLTGDIKAGNSELDVAGASQPKLGLSSGQLRLKVAGASKLNGELNADVGDIHVVGASRIVLKGAMGDALIDVAGASRLYMDNLTVHNAGIRLAGASQCRLRVDGKMDAELAGASRLFYSGNPVMGNIRAVGASRVARA